MIVAYTYLGDEDVLIRQDHDLFIIQRRRKMVPIKAKTRNTLQAAEKVYDSFLKGEVELY